MNGFRARTNTSESNHIKEDNQATAPQAGQCRRCQLIISDELSTAKMGSHSPSSRKSKKHKKQKHKRHKEHKSRKNRGNSSDSDASPDVNTQLFKSRAVAQATREILAYKYELKSELREVGWCGEAHRHGSLAPPTDLVAYDGSIVS